jgi:hypothetical protein
LTALEGADMIVKFKKVKEAKGKRLISQTQPKVVPESMHGRI